MSRDDAGDPLTSDERNLLRAVASYGDTPVSAGEISRNLGISRQAASARAALLAKTGFLKSQVLAVAGRCYLITEAGNEELREHKTACLLVEVEDRMAGDFLSYLAAFGQAHGVTEVTEHGGGCCCQHCPHGGNCRG